VPKKTTMIRLREDLCRKIAALSISDDPSDDPSDDDAAAAAVREQLDPIFTSTGNRSIEDDDNGSNDDDKTTEEVASGITPLMIACDRGDVACLQ
jgi:hypothetical protein